MSKKHISPRDFVINRMMPLSLRLRVILGWIACVLWFGAANGQSTSQSFLYEGFTQPRFEIMVAATEIGQLEAVYVQQGDIVRQGQKLAQLEKSLQASSVKIAKTQSEMRGELDAASAEAAMHRNRTTTLRQLAEKKMVRPDELLRAETDLRISLAREVAAQEQLQLRLLELERYQLQLLRREVVAPMSGVISEVFHQPGEYLTPGDPAVARLLVIDELLAVFNIPAEEAIDLRVGAPAAVMLRSSSQNIKATLTTISPEIDGESGTVEVQVTLDNRDGKLKSGDRCTLQLLPDNQKSAPIKQAFRAGPSTNQRR